MAESEVHAYARACRNTQHPGCTCMHPVDGRWCGRPRNDPIHQPRPAAERERRISAMQDEDEQLADYGTDMDEETQRAVEARIAEQQRAIDAWDAACRRALREHAPG